MRTHKEALWQIAERLGNRQLIWFGVRGSDAKSLLELEQFSWCFSIIAPLGAPNLRGEVCLESLLHHRVDLNTPPSPDADSSEELGILYQRLLQACEVPSVLITYRPTTLLSSVYFARAASVEYLGMFHERQIAFESKPWVESALSREGLRMVPWRYITNYDRTLLLEAVAQAPQVLRASRTSGGAGITLIRNQSEVPDQLTAYDERLVAMAPYLYPNIPLNINACVFPSGEITLHGPSLQLVGIPCCTSRTFAYCGNDFAQVRDLDQSLLDSLEAMALTTGRWLHRMGYIGAFGIDALVYEGDLYLSEINPRFQGSSAVAARLDAQIGLPDIFTSHLAAFLGLDAPPQIHVRDLAHEQEQVAQIYCHNVKSDEVHRSSQIPPKVGQLVPQLLPSPTVTVAPEAILFKVVVKGPVTENGLSLIGDYQDDLKTLVAELFTKGSEVAS